MVDKLNKLEFMLMGLRQMNLGSVCAWFPEVKKEEIIEAIRNSPKFKLEDNMVSLKSETEIYEEELQKDILKDLMDDSSDFDDVLGDDAPDFSKYDDDLELVGEEESIIDSSEILGEIEVDSIIEEVQSIDDDIVLQEIREDDGLGRMNESTQGWSDVKDSPMDNYQDMKINSLGVDKSPKVDKQGRYMKDAEDYFAYYFNKDEKADQREVGDTTMKSRANKSNIAYDIDAIKGSSLSYETIIRLVDEYNDNVESQLNYAVENRYDVRVKSIKTFYSHKYDVRIKEENIIGTNASIYALVNKKKGIEAAYLVICNVLVDSILNYVLDNYDDEVVYFCPIEGSEVDFEVGLNEFYLKDTDIIFDKYLEHYVIVQEAEKKIKKLEVIVGNH